MRRGKFEYYVGRVPYRLAPSAPFLEVTREQGTVSLRAGQVLIQASRVPDRGFGGNAEAREYVSGDSEGGGG